MVKKQQKTSAEKSPAPHLSETVRESAQQIWLAGLGAFAKAQEEGGKVFESLVRDGVTIQRKTQTAAEERLAEAASKMTNMATDLKSKAINPLDKLESIFEDRVAKALKKLGVPTAKEIEALAARIDELQQTVLKLTAKVPVRKASTAAADAADVKGFVASPAKKVSTRRPATPKRP